MSLEQGYINSAKRRWRLAVNLVDEGELEQAIKYAKDALKDVENVVDMRDCRDAIAEYERIQWDEMRQDEKKSLAWREALKEEEIRQRIAAEAGGM